MFVNVGGVGAQKLLAGPGRGLRNVRRGYGYAVKAFYPNAVPSWAYLNLFVFL